MSFDRDLVARVGMFVAIVAGALGLSWGVYEAHDSAVLSTKLVSEQAETTRLLHEHSEDLRVQRQENQALSGVVRYVEQSVAALCNETRSACPVPPVP